MTPLTPREAMEILGKKASNEIGRAQEQPIDGQMEMEETHS